MNPRFGLRRSIPNSPAKLMAHELNSSAPGTETVTVTENASPVTETTSLWPSVLRWIPTSVDHIISAEKRLLSLVNICSQLKSSLVTRVRPETFYCMNPRFGLRHSTPNSLDKLMAHELNSSAPVMENTAKRSLWPSFLQWIPTSVDHIISSEKHLLSLVKTPYTQELVNIGSGPPGSKVRWFRSATNEPRFINTITFDSKEGSPTLVMVHGYAASQGFFFRNFDALAEHFRVIAIDQLGWGGSSRPDFTCKSTEETEAWFIDSFEEWRKAKNLSNFILLGHSFGGYIAAKYALKHPEHVQHLILVGPAGFTSETEHKSERLTKFQATWKGAILNHLWEFNFTPMKIIRGLGPFGPNVVHKYTSARFGQYSTGEVLAEEESKLLTDYLYHTSAAKASGELCMKHIFSFGAFARSPLLQRSSEWKVATTFIYGVQDWMDYLGADAARKNMTVPCEIIRVPQAGHFVFLDNAKGFHSAVLHACSRFLPPESANYPLEEGVTSV